MQLNTKQRFDCIIGQIGVDEDGNVLFVSNNIDHRDTAASDRVVVQKTLTLDIHQDFNNTAENVVFEESYDIHNVSNIIEEPTPFMRAYDAGASIEELLILLRADFENTA